MKNVSIDESAFTKDPKDNKKDTKGKSNKGNKKTKKSKGVDFIDYAKTNGIQVNLQYGEKDETEKNKQSYTNNQNKEGYQKPKGNYNKNYYNKGEDNSQQNTQDKNKGSTNEDNSYKKTYNNNSKGGQKNFKGKRPFYKVGDNKFDMFNTHLPQMMNMMPPQYNPYFSQGNVPFQNVQFPQQQMSRPMYDTGITLVDSSDQSIITFLEQYFGLDNLNKDLYLRNRIDENGFIDCDEIVKHNKMKNLGITLERLVEVLNENADNAIVEANITVNEKIVVRNREWEKIKEKLLSKEQIFQKKSFRSNNTNTQTMGYNPYFNVGSTQPNMNLNYVTMQNNYFFNGMPQENQMGFNPYGQQFPMMGGLMNQGGLPNSQIETGKGNTNI